MGMQPQTYAALIPQLGSLVEWKFTNWKEEARSHAPGSRWPWAHHFTPLSLWSLIWKNKNSIFLSILFYFFYILPKNFSFVILGSYNYLPLRTSCWSYGKEKWKDITILCFKENIKFDIKGWHMKLANPSPIFFPSTLPWASCGRSS